MAESPDPEIDKVEDDKPEPEHLGDGGKKALAAERKARRDAEKETQALALRLKEIEDKDKTEVERLTAQVAALTKERDSATVSSARLRVALDKGLTPTQAKRLVGDTEDELAADADELLSDLGAMPGDEKKGAPPGGGPTPDLKPGNGDPDTPVEETDIKALGARMFQH